MTTERPHSGGLFDSPMEFLQVFLLLSVAGFYGMNLAEHDVFGLLIVGIPWFYGLYVYGKWHGYDHDAPLREAIEQARLLPREPKSERDFYVFLLTIGKTELAEQWRRERGLP